MGWMFRGKDMANPARYAKDLLADRDLRFISRTFPLWVAVGLAIPFGLGLALSGSLAGGLTGLLWGGLVRVLLLHHMTFSINSLCHVFGRRPYATDDESRNLAWLAPFAFGEAWHNNHHAFPTSARHGLGRRQLDISAWLIAGLERCHLAWDVVRISPGRLQAAVDTTAPPARPAERPTPRPAGRVTAPRSGAGRQSCGDQPRAAAVREEADRPADDDEQPVLEADQVPEVDHEPRDPRHEAAEVHALDVGHRAGAADGGEVALVDVVEGLGLAAGEAVARPRAPRGGPAASPPARRRAGRGPTRRAGGR